MIEVEFATQKLKVDVFRGKFIVICEFCQNPLPESYVPNGKAVYCSSFCIEAEKRWHDIEDEFNRCSRIT